MTRAAKIYSYTIAAGASIQLPADGGYYKILSATGALGVARNGASGLDGLVPGQGERENFTWLTLQDQSGAANNVRVLVADSSFVDDTIYGNVNVIDGGRLLTMADAAYVGTIFVAASVGNYSCSQLWNPPGNAKWASVSRVIFGWGSAIGTVQLRPSNAALLTAGNISQPKKILTGSSNSTMQIRYDTPAALPGVSAIGVDNSAVNQPFVFEFKEPIIVQPGQGLIACKGDVNASLFCNFDFVEFLP